MYDRPGIASGRRRLARRATLLAMYGSGILGGSAGLLLPSQGDILFNIDSRIIGAILGAVLGSLLPRSRTLTGIAHATAAGLGVAVPVLVFVGSKRVVPEVLWSMVATAAICSGLVSVVVARLERREEGSSFTDSRSDM